MTDLLIPTSGYRELTIEEILRRKAVADARDVVEPVVVPTLAPHVPGAKYQGLGIDYGLLYTDTSESLFAFTGNQDPFLLYGNCKIVYHDPVERAIYTSHNCSISRESEYYISLGAGLDKHIVSIMRYNGDIVCAMADGTMLTKGGAPILSEKISGKRRDAIVHVGGLYFIDEFVDSFGSVTFLNKQIARTGVVSIKELRNDPVWSGGLAQDGTGLYVVSEGKLFWCDTSNNIVTPIMAFDTTCSLLAVEERTRTMLYGGILRKSAMVGIDINKTLETFFRPHSSPDHPIVSMTAAPLDDICARIERKKAQDARGVR